MTTPPAAGPPAGPSARILLLVASVLVTLQALALLGLAVADLGQLSGERLGLGVSVALFFVAAGLGLVAAVVALNRGAGGARGPLVVAQLISLGLAWNLRGADLGDAGLPWVPAVLAGGAVVVLACLLAPPVNRLLEPAWPDDGDAPDGMTHPSV
ncbi:hypothetical protein [Aeromicrobium marinum]|uniref:hypothetical protein n=1 Tax=Aeromicrobium marinum TaxID=219314 RepID=UPI00058B5AFA|nr:hypothetical protein [Aeromicrobium marinum]